MACAVYVTTWLDWVGVRARVQRCSTWPGHVLAIFLCFPPSVRSRRGPLRRGWLPVYAFGRKLCGVAPTRAAGNSPGAPGFPDSDSLGRCLSPLITNYGSIGSRASSRPEVAQRVLPWATPSMSTRRPRAASSRGRGIATSAPLARPRPAGRNGEHVLPAVENASARRAPLRQTSSTLDSIFGARCARVVGSATAANAEWNQSWITVDDQRLDVARVIASIARRRLSTLRLDIQIQVAFPATPGRVSLTDRGAWAARSLDVDAR